MRLRIVVLSASWALALLLAPASAALAQTCASTPAPRTDARPSLKGRVVYQSDNALHLADLVAGTASTIIFTVSAGPPVTLLNPVNASFSPDGRWVVFSAHWAPPGGAVRYDVFIASPSGAHLVNLTGDLNAAYKYEDGRFGFDGKQIVFKRRLDTTPSSIGEIWSMKLTLPATADPSRMGQPKLLLNDGQSEFSAPSLSPTGRYLYYQKGAHAAAGVYRHDIAAKLAPAHDLAVSVVPGTERYFPVVRDFTAVLLSGWANSGNMNDQLFLAAPGVLSAVDLLPLNDPNKNNSDPAPVDEDYLIFSSNRCAPSSAPGLMTLYLGAIGSADYWPLVMPGIDGSDGSLLGAGYTPTAAAK